MLGGMVLVAVLTTAMSVVQSLLLAHTTSRLDMRLMSEFYRHVLSLPMDFFLTKNHLYTHLGHRVTVCFIWLIFTVERT
jgi:ABC-type bacteriocin/lantibiotic exporter with double-glycine peptidase domain